MAKRRKEKDAEEDVDFKIPKFDEKAFITKEREKIKATVLSFIFGFIVAIITFGFWILLTESPFQWTLVFLFGIFNASWLRYLFIRFNIDEVILERRGQFLSYAIYFLTWLFVLIILVNPPFYDAEHPKIQVVALPEIQEVDGTVKIVAYVTDNSGIKNDAVYFTLSYNDSIIGEEIGKLDENIFEYEFKNTEKKLGSFAYELQTEDNTGKITTKEGSFSYNDDVIKVPEPSDADKYPGQTINYATDIKIDVKTDVDWVYYTVNNKTINVTKERDENYYITSAKYKGWGKNSQATVQVHAKLIHYFENIPIPFNNSIIDNTLYFFNVSDDNEIGSIDSPIPKLPQPKTILVPGFEIILIFISLITVGLFFKHKKKKDQP
jgi:hypothetical protein